jgi:hypothetical protein
MLQRIQSFYLVLALVGIIMLFQFPIATYTMPNMTRTGEMTSELQLIGKDSRYQSDMRQIRELNLNPKAMERIARERYFMKHDDEDIFVLSDDPREVQPITDNDAPVE